MPRLRNKTAVITGASSGIGAAIARIFAIEGAHVIVNYNNSKGKAEDIVATIKAEGGEAIAVQADIANSKDVNLLIEAAKSRLGQIDIWVNNAGADILVGEAAKYSKQQKLRTLIDVDLRGTIECCWAVAPVMQQAGQGVIINMTWDLAIYGFQGANPQMFAAAKAGVHGFSQSFARTVAPDIRVNLLAPGWIETAFAGEMQAEYYQARINEIPLKRFGKPEDVAYAALYLASDEARYITGQIIKVNGGLI